MPEDDVMYTDVKFTRLRANGTLSSSADTTYSEVNILNSEQPASANGRKQQAGSDGKSKVTTERAALLLLSVLLVAAVIALGLTVFHNMETKKKLKEVEIQHETLKKSLTDNQSLQTLKEENEALRKKLSEKTTHPPPACRLPDQVTNEPVLECKDSWKRHGGKCYYFSTMKDSWTKSRDECGRKGGELVKIDSREEQIFLEARLREEMEEAEDKFWIGLTDSEEEGRWLWVDRSPLDTSWSFWSPQEPDNWTGNNTAGEDCVRMGEKMGAADLKCWFDMSCDKPHKSICEKAAKPRLGSAV
ncbi:C-type lectin domain family 4 member A-like [Odontesthes bonariensis]|uniref:C-type lectin domain family 4 member A-like n=1 Tax=Odontesthes bonariensis TaxID=219752 RepID=UPI003F588CF8